MSPAEEKVRAEASGGPDPARVSGRWAEWPGVALFALAVGVFAVSWWGGFVYDDYRIVIGDERVQSLRAWPEIWTRDYWGNPRRFNLGAWRPLTTTVHAVNWLLAGPRAWVYHVVNTLLHGAVTLALFALAREILRSPWPAFATAALFAVHPVHTEAVANIVGRAELLAALCALLTWRDHRHGRPLRAALWLALGLLAKESAVTIWGVLVLDDLLGRPGAGVAPRWSVRPWAALAAVTVLFLVARWAVLGSLTAGEGMAPLVNLNPLLADGTPTLTRLATGLKMLGFQWWLFVWPARLSADYSWRQVSLSESPFQGAALASLLLMLGLVMFALWARRRRPAITLGLGLWFLTSLLTANLLFPVGVLFAERLLYLPSAGMCLLVGALLSEALRARQRWIARAAFTVALLVAAAASARTIRRTWDWGDGLRLWTHDVQVVPRACQAWTNLGIELLAAGRPEEAERALRTAIALSRPTDAPGVRPRHPRAIRTLVRILMDRADAALAAGEADRADALHREIDALIADHWLLEPANPEMLAFQAIRLFQQGRLEEADRFFRRAAEIGERDPVVLCNFADYLRRVGRPEEAVAVLEDLVRRQPLAIRAHELLAELLAVRGDVDLAAHHRSEAVRLRRLRDTQRLRGPGQG